MTSLGTLAGLLASLVAAPPASATGPGRERLIVGSDTFYDDYLSRACGVDVWTTATGSITPRAFDEVTSGVRSVNTATVSLVARAGDHAFRFRDVRADVVRQAADRVLTLMVTDEAPFGWTGSLSIDLTTDELVLEPTWVDATRACAALAG
jgi:hypothetical protein